MAAYFLVVKLCCYLHSMCATHCIYLLVNSSHGPKWARTSSDFVSAGLAQVHLVQHTSHSQMGSKLPATFVHFAVTNIMATVLHCTAALSVAQVTKGRHGCSGAAFSLACMTIIARGHHGQAIWLGGHSRHVRLQDATCFTCTAQQQCFAMVRFQALWRIAFDRCLFHAWVYTGTRKLRKHVATICGPQMLCTTATTMVLLCGHAHSAVAAVS